MRFEPIGTVRSPYRDPSDVPCCQTERLEEESVIEVQEEYVDGLRDLEGFSHLLVVTYLHKAEKTKLLVTPPLDDQVRGVFATRSPLRPNHIGVSVVELVAVEGGSVVVRGMDAVDGTPILDIKPYTPYDLRTPMRLGWLDGKVPLPHPAEDARD